MTAEELRQEMNLQIVLNSIGGLTLFLLAMQMMTDGLKVFAGGGLKQLLSRYTSTPLKGDRPTAGRTEQLASNGGAAGQGRPTTAQSRQGRSDRS